MGRGGATETLGSVVAPSRTDSGAAVQTPEDRFAEFTAENLNVVYLRTDAEVRRAAAEVKALDPTVVALDFETASKNGKFGSFNGSLRLIQIGLDEPERGIAPRQYVIDCFHADPKPFLGLLRSRKVEKQIHYMDFEQEWSLLHLGTSIGNIYDTCIAFQVIQRELGDMDPAEAERRLPGWEKHNNKLATLMEQYMGMRMPKDNQASDWGREKLSADQLVYATMDVAALPPLVSEVRRIAKQVGCEQKIDRRIAWVKGKIAERVEAAQLANGDDARRLERAIKRANSLEELERVERAGRQMTVLAANSAQIRQLYNERKQALAAA